MLSATGHYICMPTHWYYPPPTLPPPITLQTVQSPCSGESMIHNKSISLCRYSYIFEGFIIPNF